MLRVAMVSLGTSLWGKENLLKFLVLLKNVLRVSCASCLVTIPSFVVKVSLFISLNYSLYYIIIKYCKL